MYLRTTQRRNKDGSTVRYVQLAHNHRKGTNTQAEVLLNLGREDRLDLDGLRRLVGSINRYLDGAGALPPAGDRQARRCGWSPPAPLGAVWLLDGLWQRLGVDTALREVLGGRRFSTDVERVLFALVANRAIDPMSKLRRRRVGHPRRGDPGLAGDGRRPGVSGDGPAGRGRHRRAGAGGGVLRRRRPAQPRGRPAVLRHHLHLLRTRRPTTTGAGGVPPLRALQGPPPDLPQIVIGLAVTREGIPVRCWCWPGNTNDHDRPAGQGRAARLAAGPGRHRGRPRVLLATTTWPT